MPARTPSFLLCLACALAMLALSLQAHAQPQIEVQPQAFELGPDDPNPARLGFTITNAGDDTLDWISRCEIIMQPGNAGPRRDNPGDIIGSFVWDRVSHGQYKTGIAYDADDELVILTDSQQNYYGVLDPWNNYQVVREWRGEGQNMPISITWLNGIIYATTNGHNYLLKWDIGGNNLGRLNTGDIIPSTIAASPQLGLLFIHDARRDHGIYIQGTNGENLGPIADYLNFNGQQTVRSILWVDDDIDGKLWCQTIGYVWELIVDEQTWRVTGALQNFALSGGNEQDTVQLAGVGHDKFNLLVGHAQRQDYLVVDDGIAELFWLRWTPHSGSVPPHQSTDATCAVDISGCISGVYETDLHILSNDPVNPDVVVNISIVVQSRPLISIEWPEEAAFPDSIDFNRYFPAVLIDSTYTIPIRITNGGAVDLEVDEIRIDNPLFELDTTQFVLSPRRRQVVNLSLRATDAGTIHNLLFIETNIPPQGEFIIPVHAEVTLGVNNEVTQPLHFALSPPAPNPFNSRTTITFTLPLREPVNLAIFDEGGRLIQRLMDYDINSGEHRVTWDATDRPAGIYFCRLSAGSDVRIAKMTLLR